MPGAGPATASLSPSGTSAGLNAPLAGAGSLGVAGSAQGSRDAAGGPPPVVTDRAERAAETVLVQAVNRLRVLGAPPAPGLDVRLRHPDLGDVRMLVAGHDGETVRAELIARDPAAAAALSRATEHLQATGELRGIRVEVHAGSGGTGGAVDHGAGDRQDRGAPGEQTGPATAMSDRPRGFARRMHVPGAGVHRLDVRA